MNTEVQVPRFVELRGSDEAELQRRVSTLRQDVGKRGGIVLDVEYTDGTATVLYRLPTDSTPS